MNPFRRFIDFISYPSHSRTIGFLAFLVVLLAVPLTVNIAQKQQELRQRAAFEGGSGGGANITGTTECEQQKGGNYCDNGKCAKFVTKCLADADLPSNCINQGEDCTIAGGPTSHNYQCSELQPYSCAPTSSSPPTKPACGTLGDGGFCTGDQTCKQIERGTVDPSQKCDTQNTVCCTFGKGQVNTCTGSCLWPNIQACEQAEGFGNCSIIAGQSCGSSNACIKVGTTAGACKTDAASAVGCNVGCATVNGRNQKCHLQNRDASGQCSASCTTSGPWNCVEDATACPNGPGGTSTSNPTPSASCNASQGYVSSCQGVSNGTIQKNSAPCTQTNGQPGYSQMQCQGSCWYDSYYDQRPEKAPKTQWCYGGTLISFVVGLDGIGTTVDQKCTQSSCINPPSGTGPNKNPVRKDRNVTVTALNTTTNEKFHQNGKISFDPSSGKFKGTIDFGNQLVTGTYNFKIKGDVYLRITLATNVAITAGQTTTLPNVVNLITGDILGSNDVNALDIDIVRDQNKCLFKAASSSSTCQGADLDDDGTVTPFDYNLALRELQGAPNTAKGEDD